MNNWTRQMSAGLWFPNHSALSLSFTLAVSLRVLKWELFSIRCETPATSWVKTKHWPEPCVLGKSHYRARPTWQTERERKNISQVIRGFVNSNTVPGLVRSATFRLFQSEILYIARTLYIVHTPYLLLIIVIYTGDLTVILNYHIDTSED